MLSSSIKIFDIASGQKKKLEAAFPGGVRSMVFSDCGRYLACSSNRSREIAVFDVQANASLKPIRIAPVHGIAVNLDFAVDTSANLAVILCIFEDNGGCIVTSNLDAPANGLHEDHTDYTVTSISSTSTIISGYLGSIGSKDTNNIVLAVGQKSYPMFLQRQIRDKSGELLKEVTVSDTSADTANETEPSSQSNLSNIALVAPEVLGAHEEGGKKRPLVDEYINAPAKAPRVSFNETVKKSNSDSNELTLMERLQQLSKQIDQKNQLEGNINGTSSSEMVTTSSLVTLMDQALQSGDDVLLEQCLSNNDTDMVNETAKRLSTSKVVLLLRKLVAKFEKRPSRGLLLTKWLTAMLKYHISFLITVPDLSNQLAGLSQMLEHRLSSYTKLSSLAGRLDLLLSQVAFPNNSTASSGRLEDVQPMAVYEEE